MEQWLNLFIQVTKPVLTTIIYTGINTWFDALQEEIKERHKQQAKTVFKTLGNRENITNGKFSEVNHVYLEDKFSQRQVLEFSNNSQKNYWPLRLSGQQILEKVTIESKDLMIFVAPPRKSFPEFSELDINLGDFEKKLAQILREFIQKNYTFHTSGKGICFLAEVWDRNYFYGETSIQLLFEKLNSISCLILATEIQGSEIHFNVVYWQKNAQKYHYTTIFTFNYQNFLRESVKTRVKQWQETRFQLLELGKSHEDLQRLGGICERNYALVQELEVLAEAGIQTEQLSVNYQFDEQDYESLCQFLSICHCLLGGWVADIHYLIDENISPHLPMWLLSLEETFPTVHAQPAILKVTVSLYEDILAVLGHESSQDIPELALKLAEGLMNLPDTTFAIEALTYSFAYWRQQHQLSENATLETLKEIRNILSQRDQEYLNHLTQCLSKLSNYNEIIQIRKWVDILTEKPSFMSPGKLELSQFELQRTIKTIAEQVVWIGIDQTGYKVISQRNHCSLKLWHYDPKLGSLSLSHEFGLHCGHILAVTGSHDGQILVTSDTTKERSCIKIWHLSTGQLYRTLFGHKKPLKALAIHLGSRSFIASGSHKIKLWDLQTGESWLTLFGHRQSVSCLVISHDGQTLISGSTDKTLRIWNLNQGNLCRTLIGHGGAVKTVILSDNGRTLISGSTDKTIKLWDFQTGHLLCTLTGHLGSVSTLRVYHSYLFSGDETGRIYVWDLQTKQLLHTLTAHQQTIQAIALSSDGQRVVSGCGGGNVQLWQAISNDNSENLLLMETTELNE